MFVLIIIASTVGCSNSEKAYKDAFKRSFSDSAEELEDDSDIQYQLFRRDWYVMNEKKSRFAELLRRMIQSKGASLNIQVINAYYYFRLISGKKHHYYLTIECNCVIDEKTRWIIIDCGGVEVESKYLETSDKWYISLKDENKQDDINETWAFSYYDKSEIEDSKKYKKGTDSFWKPHFVYASKNYMYFDCGVYLKSF